MLELVVIGLACTLATVLGLWVRLLKKENEALRKFVEELLAEAKPKKKNKKKAKR